MTTEIVLSIFFAPMMPHSTIARALLPILAGLACSAGACSSDSGSGRGNIDNALPSCEEDTRGQAYVAGISKTGLAGYSLAIVDSLPAPPAKGKNRWSLELRDESGALAPGRLLDAVPFMPDHGHSATLSATLSDQGDGNYVLDPVDFFMPGYWETTITILDPGPTDSSDDNVKLDTLIFKFCVEG